MKHRQRPAETLETDVIEEARLLGESIVSGFKPSASIKFLDKNEFVEKYAKAGFEGDYEAAYKNFMESGLSGFFDRLKNEAVCTLREEAPSFRDALRTAVHEAYGHGYIYDMRAVKESIELKKKMIRGEASELESAKARLFGRIILFANEGFSYWVSDKADAQMKSDEEHFSIYNQPQPEAWEPLEHKPSKKYPNKSKAVYDKDLRPSLLDYVLEVGFGRNIYSNIEKKFGEHAVLSATKACLDVPLDEIVSDEMAELHIASRDTRTPEMAMVRCFDYVRKRLEVISGYSGPYPNDPADFEKKARELANGCEKPSPDVDVNRYFGVQIIEPKSGK